MKPMRAECTAGADASDDDALVFEESAQKDAFLPGKAHTLLQPKNNQTEEGGEGVDNVEEALSMHPGGSGGMFPTCFGSGCDTVVQGRGACKTACKHRGCTTNTKARGLCFKHGGSTMGVCGHAGCTTKAHARGLCVKHGGSTTDVCGHAGCTTKAQSRGLCGKHAR
jgi:hypothetical protein